MLDEQTDLFLTSAQEGLELVRQALPIVRAFNPAVSAIAEAAIPLLFQAMVSIRALAAGASEEEHRALLREKIVEAIRGVAAAKFGAMP